MTNTSVPAACSTASTPSDPARAAFTLRAHPHSHSMPLTSTMAVCPSSSSTCVLGLTQIFLNDGITPSLAFQLTPGALHSAQQPYQRHHFVSQQQPPCQYQQHAADVKQIARLCADLHHACDQLPHPHRSHGAHARVRTERDQQAIQMRNVRWHASPLEIGTDLAGCIFALLCGELPARNS